jgi:hypothetical protein
MAMGNISEFGSRTGLQPRYNIGCSDSWPGRWDWLFGQGEKADILTFEGSSPTMVVASQRNPVAAIVLHSSVSDISTVIVDGVIRKREGYLLGVEELELGASNQTIGRRIEWEEVVGEVERRARLLDERKQQKCDKDVAIEGVIGSFYMNKTRMVQGL